MADETPAERKRRRRWITLGEIVAVGALAVSAIGLWNSWSNGKDKPSAIVVEKPRSIPLALRGTVEDDGKLLVVAPVETAHSLDSATLSANGRSVTVGSDGRVSADQVGILTGKPKGDERSGALIVQVKARYIEAGTDRSGGGRYRIGYRWKDGGLFSGRVLRVTGFSRG